MTSQFPITDLATGISDAVNGIDTIVMNDLTWVSTAEDAPVSGLAPGGLNYSHSTGCSEVAPPGQDLHYCIEGSEAMSQTYPVYLATASQPFSMKLLDVIKAQVSDQTQLDYLNEITEADLRNLVNAGIQVETSLNADFLADVIPSDLPPADLTVNIVLPSWISTTDGTGVITLHHAIEGNVESPIGLVGTDPWDWRHEITNDKGEVVCKSDQKTCMGTSLDIDFTALDLHEWSQSVDIEFALDAELEIYRIGLPDSHTTSGGTEVTLGALPSDLLRLALDISSRVDEPYAFSEPVYLCNFDDVGLDVCKEPITLEATPESLESFSVKFGEMITDYIHQATEKEMDNPDSPFKNLDLSKFIIETEVSGLGGYDGGMDDNAPISIRVSIPKVEFTVALEGSISEAINGNTDQLGIGVTTSALQANLMNPIANAARGLSRSIASGLVSGSGINPTSGQSEVLETGQVNTTVNEEYDVAISGPISLTLPRGLTFTEFKSESADVKIEEVDGRQRITYTVPVGEFSDSITYNFNIGWSYVFGQFWQYPAVLLLLIVLFVRRRRRKKAAKKAKKEAKKAAKQAAATKQAFSDDEFADLSSFKSPAIHGDQEVFQSYSNVEPLDTQFTSSAPAYMDDMDDLFD